MKPYTLAVTSCDRHDLLKETLESFVTCAEQQPRETIILEDGPKDAPPWFPAMGSLGQRRWLKNEDRLGQVYSIERLMNEVKTDLVFWCEDDWLFTEQNFLEPSFRILEAHPDIYTVCLRTDQGHPHIHDPRGFEILEPYWRGVWGGCTWNPGLRRRSDFVPPSRFANYGDHGLGHEAALSKDFLVRGFRIAAIPRHCHHIGGGRSRAIEPIPPVKILIAIPACHNFDYGKWESRESPLYRPENEAYGSDIHISGPNPRIQAVRDSWWKDIQRHEGVTGKFFYGIPNSQVRPPLAADAVQLHVPDDYAHLPHKSIAIAKWALEEGFDFVLKCDDDTYVYVDRLVAEIRKYRPNYGGYEHCGVCTGGPGWILSRLGMRAVQPNPDHWAEDVWIGKCMGRANIKPTMLIGHTPGFSNHWVNIDTLSGSTVTAHAVKPEDMRKLYDRSLQAR